MLDLKNLSLSAFLEILRVGAPPAARTPETDATLMHFQAKARAIEDGLVQAQAEVERLQARCAELEARVEESWQ